MTAEPQVDRVRAAYEAVHAPLWRAVLAYSGSTDVADEAVAEAFAQLLRRGEGVDDPAAWAWRSAFRIAAGELKRRGSAPVSGDAAPDIGITLPEPAIDLIAALQHLTQQPRACVVLCDLADHDAPTAARLLATTAATAPGRSTDPDATTSVLVSGTLGRADVTPKPAGTAETTVRFTWGEYSHEGSAGEDIDLFSRTGEVASTIPGAVLMLFRNAGGAIIGAGGQALPAGDFAAG